MSIRFTGDKTGLRRISNLPAAQNAFTIWGFAKLLSGAPSRLATLAYTQTPGGTFAETAFLTGAGGATLRAGDNYNTNESADIATVTAGGPAGANWFFWALVGGSTGGSSWLRVYHKPVGSGSLTWQQITNSGGSNGLEAIQLGDLPFGTDGWFDGLMAHVGIYDRTYTEAELAAQALQGAPVSTANRISYHEFSAGTFAAAVVPTQGTGTFTAFTNDADVSSDMPVFAPTLTGVDTLPSVVDAGGVGTAPVITTTSLDDGQVGAAYLGTLTATGTAPITWSLIAGALPPGLVPNFSTGVITGTPTAAGAYAFSFRASNGVSPPSETALSINVRPAAVTPPVDSGEWVRLPRDAEVWIRVPRA